MPPYLVLLLLVFIVLLLLVFDVAKIQFLFEMKNVFTKTDGFVNVVISLYGLFCTFAENAKRYKRKLHDKPILPHHLVAHLVSRGIMLARRPS